jgi:hypothetical protein
MKIGSLSETVSFKELESGTYDICFSALWYVHGIGSESTIVAATMPRLLAGLRFKFGIAQSSARYMRGIN